MTESAAALKADRSCSGGSAVFFGGEVPGREVFKLRIESIIVMLLTSYGADDLGQLVWGSVTCSILGNIQKGVVVLGGRRTDRYDVVAVIDSRKGRSISIDRNARQRIENVFDRELSIFVGSC